VRDLNSEVGAASACRLERVAFSAEEPGDRHVVHPMGHGSVRVALLCSGPKVRVVNSRPDRITCLLGLIVGLTQLTSRPRIDLIHNLSKKRQIFSIKKEPDRIVRSSQNSRAQSMV
jgi:hypothetical protein